MGALQQDTAAISAQRCISLYLERLGLRPRSLLSAPQGLPVVSTSLQSGSDAGPLASMSAHTQNAQSPSAPV